MSRHICIFATFGHIPPAVAMGLRLSYCSAIYLLSLVVPDDALLQIVAEARVASRTITIENLLCHTGEYSLSKTEFLFYLILQLKVSEVLFNS